MLKEIAKRVLPTSLQNSLRRKTTSIRVIRATPGSWAATGLHFRSPYSANRQMFDLVESIAISTEELGALPLWEGYTGITGYPATIGASASRSSDQVRTGHKTGEFFSWLVLQRQPSLILEFGTAFGVSGMYWLAGLELNKKGKLYTFEPNELWAGIAHDNLVRIGDRFELTVGTFEDNIGVLERLDDKVDIAFVDAIHTRDFVLAQLELVMKLARPGALVVFDDINFSQEMKSCWDGISKDESFAASFEVNDLGIIELTGI